MIFILIVSFLILLFSSVPVAVAMGLSGIFALKLSGIPLLLFAQKSFSMVDNFCWLAIPFFVIAGEAMGRGGLSKRIIKFGNCLVGHFTGGLCMSAIICSVIFAGISGSASADTSAIGSVIIPTLLKKGYNKGFVSSLIAAGGSLGPIIPPSITMILYGSIAQLPIGKLFLAGAIPGLTMGLGFLVVCYFLCKKMGYVGENKASLSELGVSFIQALPALFAPAIVLGGIFSGFFTATESGIIAAIYSLFVGVFIYKEIKIWDFKDILLKSSYTTSIVILIVAVSGTFTSLLIRENIPFKFINWVTGVTDNPSLIVLFVILFILFIGMFVEVAAATVMLAPILYPLAAQFGLDPIHFGAIVVIALVIGMTTPPVGSILFLSTAIAKGSVRETSRYILPYLAVMMLVLFMMAYYPPLATYLPTLILGG